MDECVPNCLKLATFSSYNVASLTVWHTFVYLLPHCTLAATNVEHCTITQNDILPREQTTSYDLMSHHISSNL